MYYDQEITQFPDLLLEWRRHFREVGLPRVLQRVNGPEPAPTSFDPGVEVDFLRALEPLVEQIERRYREGPDAPLRVALFGPTGAGKSKLFSSLVGHAISPSGFRRPYTRRAFFYLHRSREAMKPTLRGEVVLHDDEKWRDILLIDTPDFDSVESKNREEAERVFLDADAFLFVTDVQKYADAATWQYLDRIFAEEKPCCVILNKLRSSAPLHDLSRRLEDRFDERGRDALEVSVPEFAIDDETILPEDTPALEALREVISRFVASQSETREILCEAFRVELERLFRHLAAFRLAAQACDRARRDVAEAVQDKYRVARNRVDGVLEVDIATALTDHVFDARLEAFDRVDRLRHLRRFIEIPYLAFRSKFRPRSAKERAIIDDSVRVASVSENLPVLEGAVLTAADDARRVIVAEGAFREALDADAFASLRLRHEEIRTRYERVVDDLRGFARESAIQAGSALPGLRKIAFFGSQLVVDAVLIALVAETTLTWPFAAVLLAIAFPLVARGVAMAFVHEEVSDYSAAIRAEHQRLAGEVLHEARGRFEAFLDKETENLSGLLTLLEEVAPYFDRVDDIVEGFARKRYEVDFSAVETPSESISPGGDASADAKARAS